ncbi:MAG: MBL fold metallo-hydrolase [Ruminococcaceae bacterium]|nr:MBL fold metallo-hydrolase [Oscillospiraceae bacterium]
MEIYNLYPGSLASNCYVLISNGRAAIIDPSASADSILDFLNKKNASPDCIILTHGHFDHMFSADTLRELTDIPLFVHECDAEHLTDGNKNAFKTFFGRDRTFRPAQRLLRDGDIITVGNVNLTVINTPGHTDGCICLLGDGVLFTGDTLFADSIGRCDLYSGNARKMRESLALLGKLDGKLKIYPGHGDTEMLANALENVSYYY